MRYFFSRMLIFVFNSSYNLGTKYSLMVSNFSFAAPNLIDSLTNSSMVQLCKN